MVMVFKKKQENWLIKIGSQFPTIILEDSIIFLPT